MGGSQPITLDLDSSIFEVHGYSQEGTRYGYSGVKGFHPLLAFWSEKRLLIGARLRAGNRTSANRATSFLGEYLYTNVVTNQRGAGSSLLKHHLARGGAENYIEEFKNGIGVRLLPSQNFMANWAWLVIAQLAYNLGQWFKLLLLPAMNQAWKFKRLRLYWFCVARRIIRGGRQTRLALARTAERARYFAQVQAAILRL